jgi:hypothetical protein
MDVSDFAFDQPADQDFLRAPDRAGHGKDLVPFGMPPIAASDWLARNRVCQVRDRTLGRLQHDPMGSNEIEGFFRRQDYPIVIPGKLGAG